MREYHGSAQFADAIRSYRRMDGRRSALQTRMVRCATRQRGFTLLELLLAMMLATILVIAIGVVAGQVVNSREHVGEVNALNREARFAMDQVVRMVSRSHRLMLPLADNPATNWPEHIREQTVPASPPLGDSTLATAVLAVTLDRSIDLDGDGTPDADNDGDGRFDEDLPADNNNDNAPGIFQVDDNGDGIVDDSAAVKPLDDNDEDDSDTEDSLDGLDNDGDGSVDEDIRPDMNGDSCSGHCAVDDNANGLIDEAHQTNDDEDSASNEDWLDPVVFYLAGNTLMQRTPVPWDVSGDAIVSGMDFIASAIADNVTRFRVERLPLTAAGAQLVDLTLELTSPDTGEMVSLSTRVRLGGAL